MKNFCICVGDGYPHKYWECECKEPILQPQTKQCSKCKLYIDRVRHILLTNPNED